jgi:predicted phosphate transport protein (TIGR00153 family)
MNNSFFSRFAPKQPKFFPLLNSLADSLAKAADTLAEGLNYDTPEKHAEYYKLVKDIERDADNINNTIHDELASSFITPFDREDINHLASAIDDTIDGINSVAKRISIYSPKEIPAEAIKMAKVIQEEAAYVVKAINDLVDVHKHGANIRKCAEELHDLENQGDEIYELFIIRLFEEEKDGIELMKVKEIMHEMEQTTDAAEHVGKCLKSILVKYI